MKRAEVLPFFDAMMVSAMAGKRGVRALPDQDLLRLASDAGVANFYFPGSRVGDHQRLFDELARRKLASALVVDDYHRTLVAARQWNDAEALAKRFPEVSLERLPSRIDEGDAGDGPHFLDYDSRRDTLTRERLQLPAGVSLVVVSHPNCGFSRAAMAEIESNPAFRKALPSDPMFVAPTFGGLRLDSVWRWNESHPGTRHVLVDSPASWAFVHDWSTPQFLFLVDGELVASVEGWPDDSQAGRVLAAAQEAMRIAGNKRAGERASLVR